MRWRVKRDEGIDDDGELEAGRMRNRCLLPLEWEEQK